MDAATDPKRSEGARMERKALRAFLRRELAAEKQGHDSEGEQTIGRVNAYQRVLDWVLTRQFRYDKRPGGL